MLCTWGKELTVKAKKNQKHKIAVFTNGWSSEYIGLVLERIRRRAEEDRTDVFVFVEFILAHEAEEYRKSQLSIFDLARATDYDGAIVLANTFSTQGERDRILQIFEDSGVPVVTTEVKLPGMSCVSTGNYRGLYELSVHLIEKHNVRKVVYVKGNEGNRECAERQRALEDALHEHDLTLMDTIPGDFGFYTASGNVNKWLGEHPALPDAFVCANDLMALGVISCLHQHGIDVPGDVIVTGFDYVHEAQTSYPLVTTVSRQWEHLGDYAYDELLKQMAHPDPDADKLFDSRFIASESCGCIPDEEAIKTRYEQVRNFCFEATQKDMIDFFFHSIHMEIAKTHNAEQFNKVGERLWGRSDFFGEDYCFCAEPLLFEAEDEKYSECVKDLSGKVDIIYERRGGSSLPLRSFDTYQLYPDYEKDPDNSNIYVFSVLTNHEQILGYMAVKNNPELLYSVRFKHWMDNVAMMLTTVRRNSFLVRTNDKLRAISMTDSLTGLYNRTGCTDVLYAFIDSQKKEGMPTSLVFVDINGMKQINDEYGHLNGDLAIKAIADALRKSLPEGWYFGRYGGDEFIAVGRYREGQTIERYRGYFAEALKDVMNGLKVPFRLSASAGMCVIRPDDNGTIDDYIQIADKSMYEEKQRAHREMGIE